MLVVLAISPLLMPAALTLPDYHYICLSYVRNFNGIYFKNKIQVIIIFSIRSVETRVPGVTQLQAKLRTHFLSLSLSLYLQGVFADASCSNITRLPLHMPTL